MPLVTRHLASISTLCRLNAMKLVTCIASVVLTAGWMAAAEPITAEEKARLDKAQAALAPQRCDIADGRLRDIVINAKEFPQDIAIKALLAYMTNAKILEANPFDDTAVVAGVVALAAGLTPEEALIAATSMSRSKKSAAYQGQILTILGPIDASHIKDRKTRGAFHYLRATAQQEVDAKQREKVLADIKAAAECYAATEDNLFVCMKIDLYKLELHAGPEDRRWQDIEDDMARTEPVVQRIKQSLAFSAFYHTRGFHRAEVGFRTRDGAMIRKAIADLQTAYEWQVDNPLTASGRASTAKILAEVRLGAASMFKIEPEKNAAAAAQLAREALLDSAMFPYESCATIVKCYANARMESDDKVQLPELAKEFEQFRRTPGLSQRMTRALDAALQSIKEQQQQPQTQDDKPAPKDLLKSPP
jgi:hypothetical protein